MSRLEFSLSALAGIALTRRQRSDLKARVLRAKHCAAIDAVSPIVSTALIARGEASAWQAISQLLSEALEHARTEDPRIADLLAWSANEGKPLPHPPETIAQLESIGAVVDLDNGRIYLRAADRCWPGGAA